ncbi:MAG: PTS system mannose/fructose/sorbose family transporter subunit IID, partial [Bacilli bacterium]
DKIQKSGLMEQLTYGAGILGLMVIGAMTSEMVAVNVPITIGQGDTAMTISDICDSIIPGLLPLLFTGFIYYLIAKREMKATTILILMAIIGIVGAGLGILG